MSKKLKFGLVFCSLIFLLGSLGLFYTTYQFIAESNSGVGIVVEIKSFKSSSDIKGQQSGPVERPVVEFLTINNKIIKFVPKVGSTKSSFVVGQKITVIYQIDDPQSAMLDSFETTWLFPIILLGMSLLIFGIAILLQKMKAYKE